MFSGIIPQTVSIQNINSSSEGTWITIDNPHLQNPLVGDSIAVDGACLTIANIQSDSIQFFAMPETLRKTIIPFYQAQDEVNIEYSLQVGQDVGGHFVYGHIDGLATVKQIEQDGEARLITLSLPPNLMKYMTIQGTVALNGVSLTVARLDSDNSTITISLLEHTWTVTNLKEHSIGSHLNLECDMMAKYIVHYVEKFN